MSNPSPVRVVKNLRLCSKSFRTHVPQNQHDKLLIASGHLSVRVRPSVTQDGQFPTTQSHSHLQLSDWMAVGVSKPAFTVWVMHFNIGWCHSDDFKKQFSPTPDGDWATFLLSFIKFIWQPQQCPTLTQSLFYRRSRWFWGKKLQSDHSGVFKRKQCTVTAYAKVTCWNFF